MPVAQTGENHVIEAIVSGPDGANRLYTCSGTASYQVVASGGETTQVLRFLIGPNLARGQFHRAIGTASVSQQDVSLTFQVEPNQPVVLGANYSVEVSSVEADWDDESGHVEVRAELRLTASNNVSVQVGQLRYWVAILAELPQ